MLSQLRRYAISKNIPIIKEDAEKILINQLKQTQPKLVVEIGTAIGYSSLVIASTIQKRNGRLITFEISYPSYIEALNNFYTFQQFNITAYNFDPLQLKLEDFFCKNKIDFLFIDAVMKLYLDFYIKFEKFLRKKAPVLLDNVVKFRNKTIPLYEFLKKNQIKYQIFPVRPNDGMMLFYKN